MHPEHHHGHHHGQMKESWGCDQQSLGAGFLRTRWEAKCLAGISREGMSAWKKGLLKSG